jgi:hypothetical protein
MKTTGLVRTAMNVAALVSRRHCSPSSGELSLNRPGSA